MKILIYILLSWLITTTKVATATPTTKVLCHFDYDLIAKTIYGEARGESKEGQQAIANVIRNRMKDCRLTSRQVIKRKGYNRRTKKFERAFDGSVVRVKNWRIFHKIKRDTILYLNTNEDITNGATHFYSGRKRPYWTKKLTYVKTIGNHHFYK